MPFGRVCEEPLGSEAQPLVISDVMSEFREIKLPEDLCAAAEKKFGGRFGSVEELVAFLLRDLVSGDTVEMDRAEKEAVEQRLKDLGYL
jgi:hypothetical protein